MIILDTCAVIWDALLPGKLSALAQERLEEAFLENNLIMCDISFWEISMLSKRGRIQVNTSPSQFLKLYLEARKIKVQSITPEIAELSTELGKEINSDPADRLIAASSIVLNAPIITADRNLQNSKMLQTIW